MWILQIKVGWWHISVNLRLGEGPAHGLGASPGLCAWPSHLDSSCCLITVITYFSVFEMNDRKAVQEHWVKDFPAGPVVKTLCFHCRGLRFDLWSGN